MKSPVSHSVLVEFVCREEKKTTERKINELHKGITVQNYIITAPHIHLRSKNSAQGGVSRVNYSHCGETLLLRFLLQEFHSPSPSLYVCLSRCLGRLLCDSWYLTSHLVIFCCSREVTFHSPAIPCSSDTITQSRHLYRILTDEVAFYCTDLHHSVLHF